MISGVLTQFLMAKSYQAYDFANVEKCQEMFVCYDDVVEVCL